MPHALIGTTPSDPENRKVIFRRTLNRLSMYPMIIAENNRMGFARIGKTRITYIRKGLRWKGRSLEVNDMRFSVNITFPKTNTKKRNIIVKLNHTRLGSCECSFLFTGDTVHMVRKRYFKGHPYWHDKHDSLIEALENQFFCSSEKVNAFFGRFFTSFTYTELGRDNKNVRDYLEGRRFRLSVIQFQSNPFLVIKKLR